MWPPLNRREATCGRLSTVERPRVAASTPSSGHRELAGRGHSTSVERPFVASRRQWSGHTWPLDGEFGAAGLGGAGAARRFAAPRAVGHPKPRRPALRCLDTLAEPHRAAPPDLPAAGGSCRARSTNRVCTDHRHRRRKRAIGRRSRRRRVSCSRVTAPSLVARVNGRAARPRPRRRRGRRRRAGDRRQRGRPRRAAALDRPRARAGRPGAQPRGAKLGIGPPIRDGFYYDFDVETPFHPEDLKALEKAMQRIINEGQTFVRRVDHRRRRPRGARRTSRTSAS